MRTILGKILLWSLVTFALSLLAYGAIWRALETHGPKKSDPFWSMVALVEDDACRAYEEGGPDRLATHLRHLDEKLPGEHILTDKSGRDLVSGTDWSGQLRAEKHHGGPGRLPDGRVVFVAHPRHGRYQFITITEPWFEPPNILPYYGAFVFVVVGMGTILAAHLAAPLRRLGRVVERFGQGDLSARADSARRDEIGDVSRAFDEMAGRIETLVSAERRLLQDVSHELRSPLARLGYAIELARTSEDRQGALDRIQKDIGRLNHLVNELLHLTRAEGDPAALEPEIVRLDELLLAVVDDCALEATAKGCRVTTSTTPASIKGERELLHRAIENIIRNAVRHAPEATTIATELRLETGTAQIITRDQGEGVPEASLISIFEPFFRVAGDRSRASGGMGLGLAIAQRAIQLHNGQITAQNANPGLLVTIEIPNSWSPNIVEIAKIFECNSP